MSDTPAAPAPRFTLRQLPLPAKLVLSTFLLAVGVGYTSAMVQLHMQHGERDGKPLPTVQNVVAVFAGKVWKNEDEPLVRTASKFEVLVMGDKDGSIVGSNMAPAFFKFDGADYKKQAADPARKPKLDQEREGERKALVAWANAAPEAREVAYQTNSFTLPKELAKQVVTPGFTDRANPGTVKVKSIIKERCLRCHEAGADVGHIPLTNYDDLAKYLPVNVVVPPGGGYVDSGRQISLEKLTQSTHAHLLSFAVLFACTGLVFAFTGLPGVVRGTVGPLVLVAQVADISCWWLARLPEPYGPAFAYAIMGTGAAVGLGLAAHIIFGLFGMYGPKGKAVLVLMFAVAAGGGGAVWKNTIEPYLAAEKAKAEQKAAEELKRLNDEKAKAGKKDDGDGNKVDVPPAGGSSGLERVLIGSWKDGAWVKDGKVPDGGMVRAFFDKESEFKDLLKEDKAEAEKLVPQREGEREGLLAWAKAAPDVRKKAYDDNAFPLPEAVAGKPTPEFTDMDGKRLKVQSLIESRCLTCHASDSNVPLDTYAGLSKFFAPAPAAAVTAPAANTPIPMAKE
ncbi:hypothetical protein J0H58_28200 [bacterium]|nr:hypothetical protein [bacterium]